MHLSIRTSKGFSRLICDRNVSKINEPTVQRTVRGMTFPVNRLPTESRTSAFMQEEEAPTPSTWREVGRSIKKQLPRPVTVKNPWTLSSSKPRIHSFYATENCFWWTLGRQMPDKIRLPIPGSRGGGRRWFD